MLPNPDEVEVRVNPRLKHTYVQIGQNGTLLLKAPKPLTYEEVAHLLHAKASWIVRALNKERRRYSNRYTHNGEFYLWGEKIDIQYIHRHTVDFDLHKDANKVRYAAPSFDAHELQAYVERLYETEVRQALTPLIAVHAEGMGVTPTAVRFRKTTRQWGSCSSKGRVSLNIMLAKVPLEIAEYVVVHELAHLRYGHHRDSFWKFVASRLPDMERRRRMLSAYTTY